MELKAFLWANGKQKAPDCADPLSGYITYIANYIGEKDLVRFCFEAMLNGVDFRQAEHSKWSAISPDFSFIKFENYRKEEVRIFLNGTVKQLFQQAKENSVTDYIFQNQSSLVARIGGIIMLSTGVEAYSLKGFSDLYHNVINGENNKRAPGLGETRLCLEPWVGRSVGMAGEMAPCSQLPAMWNFDNIPAMSEGISFLQESLLKGALNCVCQGCRLKTVTSITQLQQEVAAKNFQSADTGFFTDLLSLYKTNKAIILPPPDLRFRISGTSDDRIFVLNGLQGSTQMMHFVAKYDRSKEPAVLDWGCGCGRYANNILQQWPQFSYTGSDIDQEAIAWCNNNISGGTFMVNGLCPPTSFAAGQFSAVIASSVMTHLNKESQLQWLEEMYRILKPEGVFVASVLGFTAAVQLEGLNEKLKRQGIVDDYLDPALDGIAPKGYYRDVFQTEEYTRKNWSPFFEIKEYLPAGLMGYQDLVVLVKKEPDSVSFRKKNWLKDWLWK